MNKLLMAGLVSGMVMALTGCVTVHERTAVDEALGRTARGRKKNHENQLVDNVIQMPAFMDAKNLIPYVNQELKDVIPWVKYKTASGVAKVWFECE